jgi:hypothetical protein
MPIEIKELHIKAVVGAKDIEPATGLQPQDINKLKKEITKEVMEKILRALRQKNER